jgi:hypothetical protein
VKSARLDQMVNGWFVGDFSPCLLHTSHCEVGIKRYRRGDREAAHVHRKATEITAVVEGTVRMCGREWSVGDLVLLEPGEVTAFEALTDAVTVVFKAPSVPGDKHPA